MGGRSGSKNIRGDVYEGNVDVYTSKEKTKYGTIIHTHVRYEKRKKRKADQKWLTTMCMTYGFGVTTVKVQQTSGLIPKTVDKYDIPSIYMKDIEFR